jgi:hypothetical protein
MPWKAELNKENGKYQIKNLDTKVLSKRQFKDKDKAENMIRVYQNFTQLKKNKDKDKSS